MWKAIFKMFPAVCVCICISTSALAATIQYIGGGRNEAPVAISFSRNNGSSWQNAKVGPGQTLTVPPDATHLNINNVPYDPKRNYKIRKGNVF
jgi:hypothetical protein